MPYRKFLLLLFTVLFSLLACQSGLAPGTKGPSVIVTRIGSERDLAMSVVKGVIRSERLPFSVHSLKTLRSRTGTGLDIGLTGKGNDFTRRYPRTAVLGAVGKIAFRLDGFREFGSVRCRFVLPWVDIAKHVADITVPLRGLRGNTAMTVKGVSEGILDAATDAFIDPSLE